MPVSLFAFVGAAVAEIAGCFAFWAWLRLGKSSLSLIPGLASLALFAYLLTLVDAEHAGRSYAAYGGVYIASALVWLWLAEGVRPDRCGSHCGRHLSGRRRSNFAWPEGRSVTSGRRWTLTKMDARLSTTPRPLRPAIPRTVWTLGFVSLFMDISSEMIHALLPLFLTTTLGASVLSRWRYRWRRGIDRVDFESLLRLHLRQDRAPKTTHPARLRPGRDLQTILCHCQRAGAGVGRALR